MNGSASRPEFGNDERHPLRHQPGDERHVAREPVELGHQHRALGLAGGCEGGGELRTAIERKAGEVERAPVGRGIAHLAENQGNDGLRKESRSTATGFPRVFYLRYHGYRRFSPPGRWRAIVT